MREREERKVKTVLVVDDEKHLREILGEILRAHGFRTIVCEDGEHAIRRIDEADALITDFKMPGMNGVELAEKAKGWKSGVPVLLITGNRNDVPSNHLADKVIKKPFRTDDILTWLREVGVTAK